MATEYPGISRSFAAAATLAAFQYMLMKHHTVAGQVTPVDGATNFPIGLLQNAPAAVGRAAEVMMIGWSKANVEASTNIGIGEALGPNTDARLITKMALADNEVVCALAEEAATSATGDIIPVMIFPAAWVTVA